MTIYKRTDDPDAGHERPLAQGEVLVWKGIYKGVSFICPCGEREVAVCEPPHTIEFDGNGILTIEGSCGYRARTGRPSNWCHFDLTDGKITMYGDSRCPGGDNSIP